MKRNLSQNITYWLGVIAFGLVVGISIQFAKAWTEPSVAPPGGNVAGPITTGSAPQLKNGPLGIDGVLSATNLSVGSGSSYLYDYSGYDEESGNMAPTPCPCETDPNSQACNEWPYPDTGMAGDKCHIMWSPGSSYPDQPYDYYIKKSVTPTALYVDSRSNVGVGKNNPGYKLDVAGDINFTGILMRNGNAIPRIASFLLDCKVGPVLTGAPAGWTVSRTGPGSCTITHNASAVLYPQLTGFSVNSGRVIASDNIKFMVGLFNASVLVDGTATIMVQY